MKKIHKTKELSFLIPTFRSSVPFKIGITLSLTASVLFFSPLAAQAGLLGPQVVSGRVSIHQQGNLTDITTTPGSIINWKQFSLAAGREADFKQLNARSTVLNRVIGGDPSEILGKLISNGQVFLINPAGIAFGEGAVINTAGLIASTLNLSNQSFKSGDYHFKGNSQAVVANAGQIIVTPGGNVMFFGVHLKNTGVIHVTGGTVSLRAGNDVVVTDLNNPHLSFVVASPKDSAVSLSPVLSSGGSAALRVNLTSVNVVTQATLSPAGNLSLGRPVTIKPERVDISPVGIMRFAEPGPVIITHEKVSVSSSRILGLPLA